MTAAVSVFDGRFMDVSAIPADALLGTLELDGSWGAFMDPGFKSGLQRLFKEEVEAAYPLSDGDVVIAFGNPMIDTAFGRIIFIVDGYESKLEALVESMLRVADDAGLTTVCLPLLRIHRRFGVEDPVMALAGAVKRFTREAVSLKEIVIAVHDNAAVVDWLRKLFE